jgi:Uma2 family endonuclease
LARRRLTTPFASEVLEHAATELAEKVSTALSSKHMTTVLNPPEQKVILKGVTWETYIRLLSENQESAGIRFNYDRGVLEIMVLSFEHETLKHTLALIVELLSGEMNIDVEGAGSTTFRREDLSKGFEPDACFYIVYAKQMRGKKDVDLTKDPPPDLVIEIDITSPSLAKLPIYLAAGVPEVWRYSNGKLAFLKLKESAYIEQDESSMLPKVTSSLVNTLLECSKQMSRPDWLRRVREAAHSLYE